MDVVGYHLLSLFCSTSHRTIHPPRLSICRCSTRYGAAELHAVASLMGGIAAQEAVKLLTHQYVPLNNTYVYVGIAGAGGVFLA